MFYSFQQQQLTKHIMLENNRLYRRIQTSNLFKTFSRTYSRQTAKLHSQTEATSALENTNMTYQQFDRTEIRSCLDQRRASSLNNTLQSQLKQGETAPAFLRTQHDSICNRTPFTKTFDLTLFNSKLSKTVERSGYLGNAYLNNFILKKKDSDSLLINLKERRREQQFRLKSCMLKQKEQYQGERDSSEFSILELEQKEQLRKGGRYQHISIPSLNIQNIKRAKQLNSATGRRVAAHLFSRYVTVSSISKNRPDPLDKN